MVAHAQERLRRTWRSTASVELSRCFRHRLLLGRQSEDGVVILARFSDEQSEDKKKYRRSSHEDLPEG